jgi:hypothetical protein
MPRLLAFGIVAGTEADSPGPKVLDVPSTTTSKLPSSTAYSSTW